MPPISSTTPPLVVIAVSAGGLKALRSILSSLSADFPAPIVVVQHLHPRFKSQMAFILNKYTPLLVKQAAGGETPAPGMVYVAPPDWHLLVSSKGTLVLSQAPTVRFLRPSADVLFESVAASYAGKVIAVVLTGTGRDGSEGAVAVKKAGGIVVAQNQATSEFFGMPEAVIRTGCVDHIVPLDEMASTLTTLAACASQDEESVV